ncbi:hypothetical protein B0H16DRAFT_1503413 [Mycena metata]|uniref:Uncharacterized protein n=1 Tax=Mycena metata TaxID=1033252 RepID=A0AAD7NW48_9AGAR|nr:hypothetical protein B0H16DRAFT_1503413 [Mycena metata]
MRTFRAVHHGQADELNSCNGGPRTVLVRSIIRANGKDRGRKSDGNDSDVPSGAGRAHLQHAWGCLSTSSHGHAHSMATWMLVSREWLKIVLYVVFRDLWITSSAHIKYIVRICTSPANTSFICQLGGITDVHQHLTKTCRSLAISVYHSYEGEFADQCTDLLEYATTDSHRDSLLPGHFRYENPVYAIPTHNFATVIRDLTPRITVLHFVLIDCAATYRPWDTSWNIEHFPLSLTELHVSFVYTSPPPTLLLDAPRGTFYPPRNRSRDMPPSCHFDGVRRLVVRDANPDFVAFLTTSCPLLERVESTAEFCAKDLPKGVPEELKDKLVCVCLPRTAAWPGVTGGDSGLIPEPLRLVSLGDEWVRFPAVRPARPTVAPVKKKRKSIWRLLKGVLRDHEQHS